MSPFGKPHGVALRRFGIGFLLPILLLATLSAGCAVHRTLRLTEVGKNKVELYLDEPAANRLALREHRLIVSASDNTQSVLDFSVLGRDLAGGEFLIVWEDAGHTGPAAAQPYPSGQAGVVPGIVVPTSFFGGLGDKEAAEIRIEGKHSRGIVTDLTDDCVRFGASAVRPRTGGTFIEDDSLPMPRGSVPLQRWWDTTTARPIDTDREADWTARVGSWGVKTN